MSNAISIADLPIVDDLDVPVNPDEYVDQANPAPLAPGNYRFTPVSAKPRTKKDSDELLLVDGKYPVLVLEQVKVVEPTDNERQAGVFTDIRFKPFTRKGVGGREVPASDVWDYIRAFDETITIEGSEHANQLLAQYFEQSAPFLGQISWTGYDKDYVDAEFSKLGASTPEERKNVAKDISNAIYKGARLNTKDFVQNGQLQQSVTGRSGNTIEAKPKISRVFPSLTEIGKGKDANNRQRIELGPFTYGGKKK